MQRNTKLKLENLIRRLIKEEEAKVSATPVVKKGQRVKVLSYYDNKWKEVTAAENSEYSEEYEDYEFLDTNGACITWDHNSWVIDPAYQA